MKGRGRLVLDVLLTAARFEDRDEQTLEQWPLSEGRSFKW
jgi:hypothetical protein